MYVVGTQKNCLIGMVLLSTPSTFINWCVRKELQFFRWNYFLVWTYVSTGNRMFFSLYRQWVCMTSQKQCPALCEWPGQRLLVSSTYWALLHHSEKQLLTTAVGGGVDRVVQVLSILSIYNWWFCFCGAVIAASAYFRYF